MYAMTGAAVPQDDIATLLELDPKTLRKHFRRELDRGSIEATAKVGQSLFRMATEGGSVAAAIFWMEARAGWREKQEVTVSAEAGMAGVMIYLPHNGRDELPPEHQVLLSSTRPEKL
jgi:hypothetical protein